MKKTFFGSIAVLEVVGTAVFLQTAFQQANHELMVCAIVFAFASAATAGLVIAEMRRRAS